MSAFAQRVLFALLLVGGVREARAHDACVFDDKGNLLLKSGQPTVLCSPWDVPAAFNVELIGKDGKPTAIPANAVSARTSIGGKELIAFDLEKTTTPATVTVVITDDQGIEVHPQPPPAKTAHGVYSVRTYRSATTPAEARTRIEDAKKSVTPSADDVLALQHCWADWAVGLSGACGAAGMVTLHSQLQMRQRNECAGAIGIELKAKCAWYAQAMSLASQALKPIGDSGVLSIDAQCAAVTAMLQSSGAACNTAPEVQAIRDIDKILHGAPVGAGPFEILVSQSEFIYGNAEFFRTVDFLETATMVNPSEESSYVAITNFPHELDAVIEWKAELEDSSQSLRNAAGFVGFLIASYAHQSITIPSMTAAGAKDLGALAPPEGIVLKRPNGRGADPTQALLDLLPPENPNGTRFIGPMRPQQGTRYRLSIVERVPEGKPRTTMMASQTIDYLPRYTWLVTLNAGVSVDGFANETKGVTAENPIFAHEWVPAEVGATSTSFSRESTYVAARRVSPFIGLLISPPWAWVNQDSWRLVLQATVGVPLSQPRGVAQFGLGIGAWWRKGFSLVFSGVVRFYDQPISPVGAAQLVLANNGASAPPAPAIGVREAVAGGLGVSLGFDLGVVGGAFLDAVKPIFTPKETK